MTARSIRRAQEHKARKLARKAEKARAPLPLQPAHGDFAFLNASESGNPPTNSPPNSLPRPTPPANASIAEPASCRPHNRSGTPSRRTRSAPGVQSTSALALACPRPARFSR